MSDAFDQMKKIQNGDYKTEYHYEEKQNKICNNENGSTGIKNFILKWGRWIIDFFAWFDVVIAIIFFVIFLSMFLNGIGNNEAQSIIAFILMIFVPLLIILFTIAANYFIYLIIDIRDSLKEISEKNIQ